MDENRLDIPVGERFKYRGHVYEVRESTACRDCYFSEDEFSACAVFHKAHLPYCDGFFRKDEISVIFVYVGAEEEDSK